MEVDAAVLKQAVSPDHGRHHHRHATEGGVVVVDGLEACLKEGGEVIEAGLTAEQLVEVGELIMVKRAVEREIEMGGGGKAGKGEEAMRKWLKEGNVIYKSVGLGVMDVCVGEEVVKLAEERGIGVQVEGF